ncbi:MAG: D-alanyl-D-alanine carboxypeptidase, partial [Myxococcales bacterium]|nr:D-alanyl-D-alanine carboxypeptidase [Myxococcales bacterium]
LLDAMLARPAGLDWRRTFSIGAVIGTLGSRMTSPDTAGRFYGKTGTLTGVIATSGVLFHRHDGHRYLISALMNDVSDSTFARSLEDQIVAVVGDDHRGFGARPERVSLRTVLAPGDGTLAVSWEPVAGATAYLVWLSDDGLVWDRSRARLVTGTSHLAGGLPSDRVQYVRITATNTAGEGDPSDVLAGRTAHEPASILLVDGDDRWVGQPENPMGHGHDFLVGHASALGARAFESVSHHAIDDGTIDPADYDAVLWQLGEQSNQDGTFSPAEQSAIEAAVAGGTHLLVSGAELAWDLDWLGDAADQAFLHEVLHVAYVEDDAETSTTRPVAGGMFAGLPELEFYTPGTQDVAFPDQLAPRAGGVAELAYVGGIGGTAAVSFDGLGRTVVLGFPFEALDGSDRRDAVMARVLDFFGI